MFNWNTVFVKYCDGSSYAGDATVEFNVSYLPYICRQFNASFIVILSFVSDTTLL